MTANLEHALTVAIDRVRSTAPDTPARRQALAALRLTLDLILAR